MITYQIIFIESLENECFAPDILWFHKNYDSQIVRKIWVEETSKEHMIHTILSNLKYVKCEFDCMQYVW